MTDQGQTAKPIVIDCDPGVDDAIALLLAFASPELHLLGITTVAGNVPLVLTQKNARRICELAGRTDVAVYAGCSRPIMRSLATAEEVHGKTGLGTVQFPEPTMPLQPKHGVDFLVETLMAAPERVTLATLGPLTNVAIALIKEPRIALQIEELVFMGGAIAQGNVTSSAEFNIYVDPHAAQVVLTSGIPLTMIGLDVTHQILTTPERLAAIRAIDTPVGQTAADLLGDYSFEVEQHGWAGNPLHDPCVIAYLLQPDLFTAHKMRVDVEVASELTMGRTVINGAKEGNLHPNVNVVLSGDADGFHRLLAKRLATL
ncbi:nucleoside hydrolase [Oscillatoria sp. FACHB-1407]|uniref:nucleoside hydrolase n=1 Tax=Oscillatoria sp. FACHB-1407 TaxID=2692847 RepID=UPI0016879806|nr:nucleoside hydrolase [Oscillatoria sp. FACHB-1407]MBD2464250.1 nucleoside hydrolase [Oscillatoria sp. FACHB-1407]